MNKLITNTIGIFLFGAIIINCDLFNPKEKISNNELTEMLALQAINAASASEGQRLGLNIAYSHRFKTRAGVHLFCREYSTAYLEKQAEWEKDIDQTYATIGNAIGVDIIVEKMAGPCTINNKISACHYDGVDGINDLIPYAYTYQGEHDYLIPAFIYYGVTNLKNAKEACEQNKGTYVCYDPSQCWQ
ncbi:LIC_11695 family lipoprotein [Leptospira sp. 96542]|nr:LIC_11695 family lipoprotein [Leptospira sp. 96542]